MIYWQGYLQAVEYCIVLGEVVKNSLPKILLLYIKPRPVSANFLKLKSGMEIKIRHHFITKFKKASPITVS